MLNFDFLEKGLRIVFPPHLVYNICYTLLTDQILLSDCFYFMRCWSIYVLELLVNQVD